MTQGSISTHRQYSPQPSRLSAEQVKTQWKYRFYNMLFLFLLESWNCKKGKRSFPSSEGAAFTHVYTCRIYTHMICQYYRYGFTSRRKREEREHVNSCPSTLSQLTLSRFSPQYSQEPEPGCSPLIKVSHSVASCVKPVGALIILPKTDPRPVLSCKYPFIHSFTHRIVFGNGAPLHTKPSLSHSQKKN